MKSLKKMFIMLVISAILLVACGRKDPLNRQAAYFEITEECGGDVYGVQDTYRANTEITREQFLDQDEDVVKALKDYIEEAFADYNDINDDTRMQLELINQTLAELQAKRRRKKNLVIQ